LFSGIIEEIGIVKKVRFTLDKGMLKISCKKIYENLKLGDSINVDGVCLTISKIENGLFSVDISPETYKKSTLKYLKTGMNVNLERSITINTLLGGHIVLGHIDEVGRIIKIKRQRDFSTYEILHSLELSKYIVKKGSISIDGISLTIIEFLNNRFSVSLVPYTLKNTTLGDKRVNDRVNLEADILAKYCHKFISDRYENQKVVDDRLKKKIKDLDF